MQPGLDLFGHTDLPRETSLKAYDDLVKSGKLGEYQLKALWALAKLRSATAQEVAKEAVHPGLWKRMSELRDRGYVMEIGQRKCSVTGRLAIVWSLRV